MGPSVAEKIYSCLVSGDSISRGVIFDEKRGQYAVLDRNYVALVQGRIKGMVRNVSRFGNTLMRGIGKLGNDIAKIRPDIVLIEYGGNDCDFDWKEIAANPETTHKPNTDPELFQKTLTETIGSLEEKGIVPVLMTLPPLDAERFLKWVSKRDSADESSILKWLGGVTQIYRWQEGYSASIAAIAEKTKTRCIDIRAAFLRHPDYSSLICRDGIHPNEKGHVVIADAVMDYIENNFSILLSDRDSSSMTV